MQKVILKSGKEVTLYQLINSGEIIETSVSGIVVNDAVYLAYSDNGAAYLVSSFSIDRFIIEPDMKSEMQALWQDLQPELIKIFQQLQPVLKDYMESLISPSTRRRNPYIGIGAIVVILVVGKSNNVVLPSDANDPDYANVVQPIIVQIDDFGMNNGRRYIGYVFNEDDVRYHFSDAHIINVIDYGQAEGE